jgi:hypothetical protein
VAEDLEAGALGREVQSAGAVGEYGFSNGCFDAAIAIQSG